MDFLDRCMSWEYLVMGLGYGGRREGDGVFLEGTNGIGHDMAGVVHR